MKFGEVEIYILSDGTHTQDGGPMFEYFPRDIWSNYVVNGRTPYKPDEHNNIQMASNCLLIRHPKGNVLVETGVHDKTASYAKYHNVVKSPSLIDSLKAVGLNPEDISLVVNTHLHPDHVGWNTRYVDGKLRPTFSNAKYVIQKSEFKLATNAGYELKNDYFNVKQDAQPLEEFGCLELVIGEKEILPGIFVVPTPGHTAGHQSVIIKAEGKNLTFTDHLKKMLGLLQLRKLNPSKDTMFYAADASPFVFHHEKPRCKMSFDALGRDVCFQTKKELVYDLGAENKWFAYFYHDVALTIGRMEKTIGTKGDAEYKVVRADMK